MFSVFLTLINLIEGVEKYSPTVLLSKNMELLAATAERESMYLPIVISLGITAVFIILSSFIYNKKEV